MGNAAAGCRGAGGQNATRTPGGPLVLSVVRTSKWGLGSEEDVWQVEVLGTATVSELKARIQELYDVPQQMQRLSLNNGDSEPALEDNSQVEALAGKRIYLNPASIADLLGGLGMPADVQAAFGNMSDALMGAAQAPDAQAAFSNMTEALMAAAQEAQETHQALHESLQGVTYKVTFERPQEAGGKAAGKKIQLNLEALALVEAVQQQVEAEMFGAAGVEPAFLIFQGMPLPPQIPLHYAGVVDGKTVVVSKERPPNPGEQLLSMLAAAANGNMAGMMVPPQTGSTSAAPRATA